MPEAAPTRTRPSPTTLRDGRRSPEGAERWIVRALALSAGLTVLVTVGIVVVLGWEALAFFREVPFGRFLFDERWTPTFADPQYGIAPLIAGSVLVATIAGVVAVPLGLLTALFLSEYAPDGLRRVLKPALEVLAGVPTVVYGYFALAVVTPALRVVLPELQIFNALSAGLVIGIMITPLVSSLSEDAFRAVPRGLREAAFGLGATRFEVATRVVLPAAFSGVVAAFILGISRAIGETMIVAIAAGNSPSLSLNPLEATQTMTAYIVQISLGETPRGTTAYHSLFAVGATLFLFTLAMNVVSQRVVRRQQEVWR